MNLRINFEEDINKDIEHWQDSPLNFYENGAQIINWNSGHEEMITIRDFDDISELVDLNDFAYQTSMSDIVSFTQALDDINRDFQPMLTSRDSNYIFGVSKKFAWKPGIYDAIRHILNYINQVEKRAGKIETLFNRIECSRYSYANFEDRIRRLSRLRDKAKAASGNLVGSIDELMGIQSDTLEKIKESTIQANAMSDKFKIRNYITNVTEDYTPTYTNMKLWTVVIVEPSEMTIINGDGGELTKLPTPKLVLTFNRLLYKVLCGNHDYSPNFKAHSIKGHHPYINDSLLWHQSTSSYNRHTVRYPWGNLCLSAFQDDIVRTLAKNDYKSFLMGIMNWNSIYNISDTNPYNTPEKIYQLVGFPEKEDLDKAKKLSTFIGWNTDRCWNNNINYYQGAELNHEQERINGSLSIANHAVYSKYIIKDCNNKKCIFRTTCTSYIRAKGIDTSTFEWREMVESYVGIIQESNLDITQKYQRTLSKVIAMTILDRWVYLEYNLKMIDYWADKDNVEEVMKRKLSQWHQAVNEERSDYDRT